MLYLKDEHVRKIVTRCDKLTELNIGGQARLKNESLAYVIQYLPSTLVKLEVNLANFELWQLSELRKMPKLKVLNYEDSWYLDRKYLSHLKDYLPNVSINSNSEYIGKSNL